MRKSATSAKPDEIQIVEIHQGVAEFCILGTSPLLYNRMSEKAKRELLLPRAAKMNAAEKAARMKHNPIEEYRASVYRQMVPDPSSAPTVLTFPSVAFKAGMGTAALYQPGTKKTDIGRLTWMMGERIDIYGIPKLRMDVVRMADMAKTPDIRTRACLENWACRITVRYIKPILRDNIVGALLASAGFICGIGDFRQEKGKGSNGQYEAVRPDDPRFLEIIQNGGREAQEAALHEPAYWNEETEELMSWFTAEVIRLHGKQKEAA